MGGTSSGAALRISLGSGAGEGVVHGCRPNERALRRIAAWPLAARLQLLLTNALSSALLSQPVNSQEPPTAAQRRIDSAQPAALSPLQSMHRGCQTPGGTSFLSPAGLLDNVRHRSPAPHSTVRHGRLRPHPLADQPCGQPGVLRHRAEQRQLAHAARSGALRRHVRGNAVRVLVLVHLACGGGGGGEGGEEQAQGSPDWGGKGMTAM